VRGVTQRPAAFIAVTALVAGAALPSVAAASLRMNRAVARVSLGNRERAVRARLGTPTTVASDGRVRTLVWADRKLAVTFVGRVAAIITTRNPRERTRAGIGVGSSVRAVRARVPGARCGRNGSFRFCRTGSVKPGRRSTTFLLRSGRVAAVTVARAS
jgi:hypothetical protein